MLGVFDRHAGGPVSQTASPAGDVCDVEHGIAALQRLGFGGLGDAVIGAQNEIGHPDVKPAMQFGLTTPDGVNPTDGYREAPEWFPSQVVVELAVVLPMQCQAIAAGAGTAQHPGLAYLRHRPDCRRGDLGAQDCRPVEIQERTVEHQTRNAHFCGGAALTNPVQP